MLNKIIQWSIKNRLVVVIAAIGLLLYGGIVAFQAPVDVFPDLTAPTVTILTESHGMAPEEVEALVSRVDADHRAFLLRGRRFFLRSALVFGSWFRLSTTQANES